MGDQIHSFVTSLGAEAPMVGDEKFRQFRAVFPRSNYFILDGRLLIVKISRSKRPFWGFGKKYIDLLRNFDYFLVLLISEHEGWVFSRKEVLANIQTRKWKLREEDGNYKINYPLPDKNSFVSVAKCRQRLGLATC